jgi:hypothetical protein
MAQNAAGIIFRSPEGRVLLLRRKDGMWDYPGGGQEGEETAEETALRESNEETKYYPGHVGRFHARRVRNGVDYTTFLRDCEDEFTPKLSNEHTDYIWIDPKRVLGDSIKARADADWSEGDHPRDQDGKFTSGGGAGSSGPKPKPGSHLYKAEPLPETVEKQYREEVRQVKALSPEFMALTRKYHESLQGFKALKAKANSAEGTWEDWEKVQAHQEDHRRITREMYNQEPPGYFKKVAALRKHDVDVKVIEKTVKTVRDATMKVAKKMNFPPEQVKVVYEDRVFTLNGKVLNYAGSAQIHRGGQGDITMYARQNYPETTHLVAAHEIEHIRYADFQAKRAEQYKAANLESAEFGPPSEHNPVMDWNGVLKPPYDKKYPEWNAWATQREEWKKADVPNGFRGDQLLAASDGVTNYSAEYWKAYHENPSQSAFEIAIHETLAEMMTEETRSGFLPEHRWAGPMPRRNQSPEFPNGFATIAGSDQVLKEGRRAWRKLYATVNPL